MIWGNHPAKPLLEQKDMLRFSRNSTNISKGDFALNNGKSVKHGNSTSPKASQEIFIVVA